MEDTVYCKAMCGNNIHKECFNQWARSKRQEGVDVTCGTCLLLISLTTVYCRSKWDDGNGNGKGRGSDSEVEEGYMNLSKVAGLSPVRDTSTYHYSNWSPGFGRKRYY